MRLTAYEVLPTDTQVAVTGWFSTGAVGFGTGTNASFAITNDTTLTWQWHTNYWIEFGVIEE